jgi:hypothetical protein
MSPTPTPRSEPHSTPPTMPPAAVLGDLQATRDRLTQQLAVARAELDAINDLVEDAAYEATVDPSENNQASLQSLHDRRASHVALIDQLTAAIRGAETHITATLPSVTAAEREQARSDLLVALDATSRLAQSIPEKWDDLVHCMAVVAQSENECRDLAARYGINLRPARYITALTDLMHHRMGRLPQLLPALMPLRAVPGGAAGQRAVERLQSPWTLDPEPAPEASDD